MTQAERDSRALRQAEDWGFDPNEPATLAIAIERLRREDRPDPYAKYRDRPDPHEARHRQDCRNLALRLDDIRKRGAHIYQPSEIPSMKISETFPSATAYLAAKHLPVDREVHVTIADTTAEHLENEDDKACLSFVGKDKRLLLNKTNLATLVDAFGDETDQWRGKQIVLFRMMVQFQGQLVPAIRVRIPAQQLTPRQPVPEPDTAMDDEIPF